MSKSLKDWDLKPLHAKFAYNRAPSYATKHSSFGCVYWLNPLTLINLQPLPSESRVNHDAELRAKEIKNLHEQVGNRIGKANTAYKARVNKHKKKMEFNPRDLVLLHLRKERFPSRRKSKLMKRGAHTIGEH